MIEKMRSLLNTETADDQQIIQDITVAFQENKRMKVLVGKGGRALTKGIKVVIAYAYFMVKKWGGIFISKYRSTYLLFYRKSEFHFSILDLLNYLYLAIFVIGIQRVKKVYQREKIIKKTRHSKIEKEADSDYLYIWFLAQKKERKDITGLLEAKNYIIKKSKDLKLPLYMETTDERLVKMYERCGFKFYNYLEDASIGLKVWFGRYTPAI